MQAQSKFEVQEEGDLGFKQSEILTILESSRADGWLLAENALGERGLVPSNFVKVNEHCEILLCEEHYNSSAVTMPSCHYRDALSLISLSLSLSFFLFLLNSLEAYNIRVQQESHRD